MKIAAVAFAILPFAVTAAVTFEPGGTDVVVAPDAVDSVVWAAEEAKAVNEERGGIFKGAVIELEAEGVEVLTGVRYLRTPPYVGTVFGGTCLPLGTFEMELGDE